MRSDAVTFNIYIYMRIDAVAFNVYIYTCIHGIDAVTFRKKNKLMSFDHDSFFSVYMYMYTYIIQVRVVYLYYIREVICSVYLYII